MEIEKSEFRTFLEDQVEIQKKITMKQVIENYFRN